jgi:cysteine-rich repeat protein
MRDIPLESRNQGGYDWGMEMRLSRASAGQGMRRVALLGVAMLELGVFAGCFVDFTGLGSHGDGGVSEDAAASGDANPGVDGGAPVCLDGVLGPGEECDGLNLGGATCQTVVGEQTLGELACLPDCQLDTSGCVPWHCGDGQVNLDGEECDDGNSSNVDGCLNTCLVATCGDGYVWPAHEECDDGNASDEDGCLSTCELAACGDGHLWLGHEECEGSDLAGATCESLGFAAGTLSCSATCVFDTSACIPCGTCKTCTLTECFRDIWWWSDSACTVPYGGCQPCYHYGPANSTHDDGSFFCNANGATSPYWNGGPCDWVDTVYTSDCARCGSWPCS